MSNKVNTLETVLGGKSLPLFKEILQVGNFPRLVDHKDWPVPYANVTIVMKSRQECVKMPCVILLPWIGLLHKNAAWRHPMPYPRPILICPAQAERKVRFSAFEDLVEWSLEESSAGEPIMPVAKTFDTGSMRQFGLSRASLGEPQIIEAQIRRYSRLVVPSKKWSGFRDIGPLGKTRTPPVIVLGYWMKLRKVECN
jgi:hypothetical protein